jgi:hypothetical protein
LLGGNTVTTSKTKPLRRTTQDRKYGENSTGITVCSCFSRVQFEVSLIDVSRKETRVLKLLISTDSGMEGAR